MAEISYHDKDRYLISIIIAVVVHLLLFGALHFILNINIEALPDYSGPLYLELGPATVPEAIPEEKENEKIEDQETIADIKQNNEVSANIPVNNKDEKTLNNTKEQSVPEKDPVIEKTEQVVPKDEEITSNTNEIPEDPDAESLSNINDVPKKTPQSTLGPTKTSKPYDPALEEENLSQLDNLLENGSLNDSDTGETTTVNTDKNSGENTAKTTDDNSSSEQGGGPLFEWEDSQDRIPLSTKEPILPDFVSKERLRLIIEISFLLTPDGLLTSFRVEKSSGYTDVDSRIIEALKEWKFLPVSGTKSIRGRITYKTKI